MKLRDRVIALLSKKPKSVLDLPAVIPDELDRGVLRWGSPNGRWHCLLHVRETAVVAWNVATAEPGSPRAALTDEQVDRYTTLLAGVSEAELATASAERPLVFVPRAVVAPFDGFAIAHPSIARYRAHEEGELVEPITYVVFPCFASEIPEPNDVDWAKLQYREIGWSDVDRRPDSALRWGKPTPKGKKTAKHKRKPSRPRDARALGSGVAPHKKAIEIENWRGHVLRIEDGEATTDAARVSVAGREHLEALVAAFVDRDISPTTGTLDAIPVDRVWDFVEATCGDVVDGVEPVSLEERATGRTLARLWVEKTQRKLHIAYAIEDARVTREVLDAAIADPYLRVFTDHGYRDKVDVLRVYPKDSPADVRELPYPAK